RISRSARSTTRENPKFAIRNSTSVILRHCFQNSIPQDGAHCFSAFFQSFFHQRSLRSREDLEHVFSSIFQRMIGLNSDPHTDELVVADSCDDRLQPVVTAGRSALANSNFSQRQR